MKKRTLRLVTAAFVTGSASIAFLPIAQAAPSTQSVAPSTEAWYQPNPTCQLPTGCLGTDALPVQPPVAAPVEVPLSPYPAGSMHIAIEGGQETARSYLQLSLPIGLDVLKSAQLEVPLDLAQADGSIAPETAKVAVCTFTGSITAANGSIASPPAADCARAAKATYVATPTPHLKADLNGMIAALSSGAGLALIPDAAAVAPTDAWHVVFSAHDRADAAKTAPAKITITTEPAPATPTVPETPQVETPTVPVQQPTTPDLGGLTPTTEGPVAQPPAQQPPQTITPVPQAQTITVGYAYPAVWLLPLGFLILIPLVARALSTDLTPLPAAAPQELAPLEV